MSDDDDHRYLYEFLGDEQIRLVHILPESRSNDIRLYLEHVASPSEDGSGISGARRYEGE